MAMVKLGDGVVEINGKSGGDVFRKDQCGQHIQSTPRYVSNEPSPSQKKRRRAFRKCLNYIRRYSTVEFAYRWQNHANNHPRTNKKGETITLAWWQEFMSINIIRIVNDLDILQFPPD